MIYQPPQRIKPWTGEIHNWIITPQSVRLLRRPLNNNVMVSVVS